MPGTVLRPRYAMSSADLCYAATSYPPLLQARCPAHPFHTDPRVQIRRQVTKTTAYSAKSNAFPVQSVLEMRVSVYDFAVSTKLKPCCWDKLYWKGWGWFIWYRGVYEPMRARLCPERDKSLEEEQEYESALRDAFSEPPPWPCTLFVVDGTR
eukprot:2412865-Rhodomonas_salina.1